MKKLFAMAAIVLGGAMTLGAQEPETKNSTPLPIDVQMISIAAPLAHYGYAEGEALPLIQAATILSQYPSANVPMDKETSGQAVETTKTDRPALTVDQLLADATAMADNDANLLALIDQVRNSGTRNAVSNYAPHYDRVQANDYDIYEIRFRGGERAMVAVEGDGDTDLDVYVYDKDGNCVASDTDDTDYCVVSWYPRYTQTYRIKIRNYGNVYNNYVMRVY